MAPHSSTLAWKIPRTEETGRLQSMGSKRVGHNWVTSLSLSCIGEGNSSPLQCSCLENPRDVGAWWAAVCGVAQSQTRLKRLSSSSSIYVYCAYFIRFILRQFHFWGANVNGIMILTSNYSCHWWHIGKQLTCVY